MCTERLRCRRQEEHNKAALHRERVRMSMEDRMSSVTYVKRPIREPHGPLPSRSDTNRAKKESGVAAGGALKQMREAVGARWGLLRFGLRVDLDADRMISR